MPRRDSVPEGSRYWDVAVIGGGVVGATAALWLSRRGADVLVIERGEDWGVGCSYGNAGLVCPSHAGPFATSDDLWQGMRWLLRDDSPLGIAPRWELVPWLSRLLLATRRSRAARTTELLRTLAARSLELHRELAGELPTGLREDGLLDTYWTRRGFERARRAADAHAAAGLAPLELDPVATSAAEPLLAPGAAGAFLYPHEAHCDPLAFVRAVGAAAVAAGASFLPRAEVLRIEASGGRQQLETTVGPVAAEQVVVAAGVWSRALVAAAGMRLPLQAGKGYTVDLDSAEGQIPLPRRPMMLQEARVAVTPLAGRLRLSGTLELGRQDRSLDRTRVAAIEMEGRRRLPAWSSASVSEVWAGLRPCTADGLPRVSRVPGNPGLIVATGHAMLGLTLAPVTAELIGQLLDGHPPALQIADS